MKKSSARTPRERLLAVLDEAVRKVGAQAVLISDLVASRVGVNPTDLECLDLLQLAGPTTAGQVSAHTGLTTGATTAVIDRLERAGFVQRQRDPDDRRVVRVEVLDHCGPQIEPFYKQLQEEFEVLHERYSSRELEVVVRYLTEALEAGARHAAWLQTQPALSQQRRRHSARGGEAPATVPRARRAVRRGQEHRRPSARRK